MAASAGGGDDVDLEVEAADHLTGPDLATFAQLDGAVDEDLAVGDEEPGLAAGVRHPADLEQVAQRDVVRAEPEGLLMEGLVHSPRIGGGHVETADPAWAVRPATYLRNQVR